MVEVERIFTSLKRQEQTKHNIQLRNLRQQHHWSQKEMALLLDTTYLTVCHWENGTTLPGFYFRRKLCELFAVQPGDLGFATLSSDKVTQQDDAILPNSLSTAYDAAAPLAPPLPLWHVPYRRNLFFIGRELFLAQLYMPYVFFFIRFTALNGTFL